MVDVVKIKFMDDKKKKDLNVMTFARKHLNIKKMKALNKIAVKDGRKPLYLINEIVEPIPNGALPKFEKSIYIRFQPRYI
jgi:hypothetical protein